MEPASELAALLEAKREEICITWLDLIGQMPGSHAREHSLSDLHVLTTRGLDALLAFLSTGSCVRMESYLTNLYHTDLSVEADVADAIDALFLFKESTMSVLRQSIPCGSSAMLGACACLDSYLRHAVGFLARQHAAATNARLRERQERTNTLLEILRAAASTLDLDQVLHQVATAISSLVGVPQTRFCLVDKERGLLIVRHTGAEGAIDSSLTSPPMGESWPIASSFGFFAVDVLERQVPAVCEDTATDPRIAEGWTNEEGIRSFLAVPFVVKERVVAIAFACTYDEYRAFDEEQIELARGVANAVALTIENARLHQEMRGMAIMEERDRLAREMHDSLAQGLAVLQLKASEVATWLVQGSAQNAQSSLNDLQDMISESHRDVREAMFDMRTIVSPADDFVSTLKEYLQAYQIRSGVVVETCMPGKSELDLSGDVALQAMRILQEALINVRKHACTTRAQLHIGCCDGLVRIRVCDDGRGFDLASVTTEAGQHLGLQVMRERAESVGGSLDIESRPGKGTCITLSLPLPPPRRIS